MSRFPVLAPMLALAIAAPAAASVTIDLFPNIGPSTVTDNGAYLPGYSETQTIRDYGHNALGAMLDNQLSRGGSINDTPSAFNTLPDHKVRFTDIVATQFPSWRLNFNPTGAFANEQGTWYRVGLRVESDTPFTLGHLTASKEFPVGAPFEQFTEAMPALIRGYYPEQGFSPTLAEGIYYGADGVRGGGDDVFCDSAACDLDTQPLNLFVWRGFGVFESYSQQDVIDCCGGDLGYFHDVWERDYYAGADGSFPVPFTFHFNYTLTGDSGALLASRDWNATVDVPEPGTWAMLVAGFGMAGAAVRRRPRRIVRLARHPVS